MALETFEWKDEIERSKNALVAKAENLCKIKMPVELKEHQLRNLLNIANSTSSVREIINFIFFQSGRLVEWRKWGFNDALIREIQTFDNIYKVRYFLGYLIRYFKFWKALVDVDRLVRSITDKYRNQLNQINESDFVAILKKIPTLSPEEVEGSIKQEASNISKWKNINLTNSFLGLIEKVKNDIAKDDLPLYKHFVEIITDELNENFKKMKRRRRS